MHDVLNKLQDAYRAWNDSKGADRDCWAALLDDHLNFRTVSQPRRGLALSAARQSREQVMDYLLTLTTDWEMNHFTVKTMLNDGEKIAVHGVASWRNRKSGRDAEVLYAHLWRFRNGKAIEVVEVFDSARIFEAMGSEEDLGQG